MIEEILKINRLYTEAKLKNNLVLAERLYQQIQSMIENELIKNKLAENE